MNEIPKKEKTKREPLGRYETLCIHCGCILRNIDMPIKQYCYCRKIYACDGSVFDAEPEPRKGDQIDMFT